MISVVKNIEHRNSGVSFYWDLIFDYRLKVIE